MNTGLFSQTTIQNDWHKLNAVWDVRVCLRLEALAVRMPPRASISKRHQTAYSYPGTDENSVDCGIFIIIAPSSGQNMLSQSIVKKGASMCEGSLACHQVYGQNRRFLAIYYIMVCTLLIGFVVTWNPMVLWQRWHWKLKYVLAASGVSSLSCRMCPCIFSKSQQELKNGRHGRFLHECLNPFMSDSFPVMQMFCTSPRDDFFFFNGKYLSINMGKHF